MRCKGGGNQPKPLQGPPRLSVALCARANPSGSAPHGTIQKQQVCGAKKRGNQPKPLKGPPSVGRRASRSREPFGFGPDMRQSQKQRVCVAKRRESTETPEGAPSVGRRASRSREPFGFGPDMRQYKNSRYALHTCCFCGDPIGTRTRVTAVKGRCLNRLTMGPYSFYIRIACKHTML